MKSIATAVLAAATMAVAQPVLAQDAGSYLGVFSTVAEGFGQSLGQSMVGGQSVFVYARGKAKLHTAAADAYLVQVSTSAPTAVEAARQRDALVEKLRAAARSFSVPVEVSGSSLSLGGGDDAVAVAYVPRKAGKPVAADAPADAPAEEPAKPEFTAKASLRFAEPAGGSPGAFLDALHAAGADNIASASDGVGGMFGVRGDFLGLNGVDKVDSKVWDEATRDAVSAARDQASVLSRAAGREVGEAHQILLLTRAVVGDEATVTVAVRFGFGSGKN